MKLSGTGEEFSAGTALLGGIQCRDELAGLFQVDGIGAP
jgi:hypothetical protein